MTPKITKLPLFDLSNCLSMLSYALPLKGIELLSPIYKIGALPLSYSGLTGEQPNHCENRTRATAAKRRGTTTILKDRYYIKCAPGNRTQEQLIMSQL